MAKKDFGNTQNRDRRNKEEQGSSAINERNNNQNDDMEVTRETNVKNANASGLGSIGRNDERLTPYTSNDSASGSETGSG